MNYYFTKNRFKLGLELLPLFRQDKTTFREHAIHFDFNITRRWNTMWKVENEHR